MSSQRLKMKGKHRKKPAKPYDRVKPKGFLSKVKDFLNPWSWTRAEEEGTQVVADEGSSGEEDFHSASGSPVGTLPQQEVEPRMLSTVVEQEVNPQLLPTIVEQEVDPQLLPTIVEQEVNPQLLPTIVKQEAGPSGTTAQNVGANKPLVALQSGPSDSQNHSFHIKSSIGSLASDIFHDSKMRSIFSETPKTNYPRSHLHRMSDASTRALIGSNMSTRATIGSDTSSQGSLSEADQYDIGSQTEGSSTNEPPNQSSEAAKLLGTTNLHKQRGRYSLFASSSLQQSMDTRRSFIVADSSLSSNRLTSTPRLSQDRHTTQATPPLRPGQPQSPLKKKPLQPLDAIGDKVGSSTSFSLPAFVTPTRQRGSLSRTPFNSPFYQSGRTPYFSTGQSEYKRSRPESPSSPELPPLRQHISARPLATATATTKTFKQILQSLESFSSPLENVRRLPPRQPVQPSAKRRRAQLDDSMAPPTLPLLMPTLASVHPVVSGATGMDTGIPPTSITPSNTKQDSTNSTSVPVPVKETNNQFHSPEGRGHFSSHQQRSSDMKVLSPRAMSSRDKSDMLKNAGQHQENPLDLPSPVGLSGLKNMSGFSLGMMPSLLAKSTPPSSSPKLTTSTTPSSLQVPLNIKPTQVGPGTYVFSAPVNKSPPQFKLDSSTKPYLFSPPRAQATSLSPNSLPQPPKTTTAPSKEPVELATSPANLPKSALDALELFKKAGEQMVATEENSRSDVSSDEDSSCEVVVLSSDEETPPAVSKTKDSTPAIKTKDNTPASSSESSSLKPLSQFAPVNGSWDCDSCLVPNKPDSLQCVCCGAKKPGATATSSSKSSSESSSLKPLSQFAPVSGSWDCDSCLVPNKPDSLQCVCCGAKKPGATATSKSKPKSENTKLSTTGVSTIGDSGFKLNFSLTAPVVATTSSSAEEPGSLATTSGGMKLTLPLMTGTSSTEGSMLPTGGLNMATIGGLKLGGLQKSSDLLSTTGVAQKTVTFNLDKTTEVHTGQEGLEAASTDGKVTKFGGLNSGSLLLGGIPGVSTGSNTATTSNLVTAQKSESQTAVEQPPSYATGGFQFTGSTGLKLGGSEGLKLGGSEGLKLGGSEGLKLGGSEGLKLAGSEGLKLGGSEGLKLGGSEGLKLGGSEGLKLGGSEGLKLGGSEGLKLGGSEGLKLGGSEGLKLGGSEGLKLSGSEGLKLGGSGGKPLGGSQPGGGLESGDEKLSNSESTGLNLTGSKLGGSLLGGDKVSNPFTQQQQQQQKQQQQSQLGTGSIAVEKQEPGVDQTSAAGNLSHLSSLTGIPTSGTGLNLSLGNQLSSLKFNFSSAQQPPSTGSSSQPTTAGGVDRPNLSFPSLLKTGEKTDQTNPSLVFSPPKPQGNENSFSVSLKKAQEDTKSFLTPKNMQTPLSLSSLTPSTNSGSVGLQGNSLSSAGSFGFLNKSANNQDGLQGSVSTTETNPFFRGSADQSQPSSSLGQSTLGQNQSTLSLGQSTLGQNQSTLSLGQSTLGQNQSTLSLGQSTLGQNQSTLSLGQSTLGQNQSTLSLGQPNLNFGQSTSNQGQSILGQGLPFVGSGLPKTEPAGNPFSTTPTPFFPGFSGNIGGEGFGGNQPQQGTAGSGSFTLGGNTAANTGGLLTKNQGPTPNPLLGSGNQNPESNPFLASKVPTQTQLGGSNISGPTQDRNVFSVSSSTGPRSVSRGRVIKRAIRRKHM